MFHTTPSDRAEGYTNITEPQATAVASAPEKPARGPAALGTGMKTTTSEVAGHKTQGLSMCRYHVFDTARFVLARN